MKTIFLFLILFFASIELINAQGYKKYFNDSLIKFEIGIPTSKFKDGMFYPNPKNYIVTNVPAKSLQRIMKFKNYEWIKMLKDSNTCYSTNLLLYQITAKDATSYIIHKDKKSWTNYLKEEDIAYWLYYLKTKKVKYSNE